MLETLSLQGLRPQLQLRHEIDHQAALALERASRQFQF